MDIRRLLSFVCFLIAIKSGSTGYDYTRAPSIADCESNLVEVVSKPMFGKVGVELLKRNALSGIGFVFSHMKIFHKLITLFALASFWERRFIKNYLGLHRDCEYNVYCRAFNKITDGMNNLISEEHFYYKSWALFFNHTYVTSHLDVCATENHFNFSRPADIVLSDINQRYRQYCKTNSSYLDHNLDPRSVIYLLDVLKITADVFGGIRRFHTTTPFTDIDGQKKQIPWMKLEGWVWTGTKYEEGAICEYVELYRSEIGGGNLHMLYFRPLLDGYSSDNKIKCVESILSDLSGYTKLAIDETTTVGQGSRDVKEIAVPMMDLSTDVDLKPILENDLKEYFQRPGIYGIEWQAQRLYELREWEYFNNKPENYDELTPETEPKIITSLSSPFVFTIVDKTTGTFLKTGALLRPGTNVV